MTASTTSVSAAADRRVRLDQVGGQVEAVAVEIDQEDPGRAARPGQPDVQAADRAGADDDDVVARADPGQLLAVEDAGERLGDRASA